MDNQVVVLQITGFGENGTLIPVVHETQQRKMLLLAKNLGIQAVGTQEDGSLAIEMLSNTVYCELPRHGTERKFRRQWLKKFISTARGLGVRIKECRFNRNHSRRQQAYTNRPTNHLQ